VEVIRIEGVWFKVEDARDFAQRARIYAAVHPPPPEVVYRDGPFAFRIENCVKEEGAFDVIVFESEKVAVLAVLDEWVQSRGAPDAARTLHRALASNGETMRRDNERERRGRLKLRPQEPGAPWHEGYDLHIHGSKTTWQPPALRRFLFRLRRRLGLLRDYPL
jgi:hypothetical protein